MERGRYPAWPYERSDKYRNYILGFIFCKYLSEKQHIHANELLETEAEKEYPKVTDKETNEAIPEDFLQILKYFLKPDELFESLVKRGNGVGGTDSQYILDDLQGILTHIE